MGGDLALPNLEHKNEMVGQNNFEENCWLELTSTHIPSSQSEDAQCRDTGQVVQIGSAEQADFLRKLGLQ